MCIQFVSKSSSSWNSKWFKTSLEEFTLPSQVTQNGSGSFALCYKLKQFNIQGTSQLQKIGKGALDCTIGNQLEIQFLIDFYN